MIASRIFALLPLAVLTIAGETNQCNTGSASCCNSTQSVTDKSGLLALLGLKVGDVTGLIGVDCSPITAVGTGSGCKANQEPVCCTHNNFNGVANVGCSPLNIGL
ncbi:fungal hydrophobin [Leucogyrophana mollusca]|uniref:Fungal hydrophobin n=1 Tax=Leucogyrophana mollusca TaxID=85980 RepID=A0ACB8B204_9AGAM|nr:fungal hydrophobin [Leucogyrophana mollusca]